MWARDIEFMLGCWLAVSPFIFGLEPGTVAWAGTFIASAITIALSLLSYWHPTRHAHCVLFFVAVALIGFGRFASGAEPTPGFQNLIIIGALLAMFGLVPNQASQPPEAYRSRPADQ